MFYGLLIEGHSNVISGNTFETIDCTISCFAPTAFSIIYVHGGTDTTITGNTIKSITHFGRTLDDVSMITNANDVVAITGNTIQSISGDGLISGIRVGSASTNTSIGGNVIKTLSGYASYGIDSDSTATISGNIVIVAEYGICLLYTSPSPRDGLLSRMPSSA